MGHAAARCCEPPLALAAWHAAPLGPAQAAGALERARARLREAYLAGRGATAARLQEMIALQWLGHPIDSNYRSLVGVAREPRERALTELVYGQLLMSHRLAGAHHHLQVGFALAAPLLGPADYLEVMKRHELLAHLPLSAQAAAPQGLDALLAEAAVIRRLQAAGPRARPPQNPCDTLG
jgi:hypothetical protein